MRNSLLIEQSWLLVTLPKKSKKSDLDEPIAWGNLNRNKQNKISFCLAVGLALGTLKKEFYGISKVTLGKYRKIIS